MRRFVYNGIYIYIYIYQLPKQIGELTWLALGGVPTARSHRVELLAAL